MLVTPVTVSEERLPELRSHLMLFDARIRRTASPLAATHIENIDETKCRPRIVNDLVVERRRILTNGNCEIAAIGHLLHKAWEAKRGLSVAVSNPDCDSLYDGALLAGALGGKLTGAG